MIQDQEILAEFIIETNENLGRLNQHLVAIEARPKDAELLASVFRTFHTIKRTTGFLGFTDLLFGVSPADPLTLINAFSSRRGRNAGKLGPSTRAVRISPVAAMR
jgi:hypothetical protein